MNMMLTRCPMSAAGERERRPDDHALWSFSRPPMPDTGGEVVHLLLVAGWRSIVLAIAEPSVPSTLRLGALGADDRIKWWYGRELPVQPSPRAAARLACQLALDGLLPWAAPTRCATPLAARLETFRVVTAAGSSAGAGCFWLGERIADMRLLPHVRGRCVTWRASLDVPLAA